MKFTNIKLQVIIVVAVLLAALGICLFIRQIKLRNEGIESGVTFEPGGPIPIFDEKRGGDRLSEQERAILREKRKKMLEKMANMTEQEKEQFRAKMRERFDISRQDKQASLGLSDEDSEKMTYRLGEPKEQKKMFKLMKSPEISTKQQTDKYAQSVPEKKNKQVDPNENKEENVSQE